MQSVKRKRRCENQCQQHLFSLKNLKNAQKYDVKLTFCPKYQRQPLPPQHTFAQYNNDGLFYTSAFVLGVDKKIIAKNLQKQMLDHQKLIKQSCEKCNQIVFPRPNSKHTTCSVCKQQYKNYYLHIFSDEHTEKIQMSGYNVYLKQLCQLFRDQWEGCAEIADQQALNYQQNNKKYEEKKGSEQLNLDDILQQEEIKQNPTPIEKYFEEKSPQPEVVMKKATRIPQHISAPKPKVQLDREARKKRLNFAVFFQQQPKKKVINDHREAITVHSKKTPKTTPITPSSQPKTKQSVIKKPSQKQIQLNDPFIIEYNARVKRKQKKSYYYIKKKQRLERQMRQRQRLLGEQRDQNFDNGDYEDEQSFDEQQQQQEDYNEISLDNGPENQQQNQQLQQKKKQQYAKCLQDFKKEYNKTMSKQPQVKKNFSRDSLLFQQVQKQPFSNKYLQSITNNFNEKYSLSQKASNSSPATKKVGPEMLYSTYANKASQNIIKSQEPIEKKNILFQQKQKLQIVDNKNKIDYTQQNQLPKFHRFFNPSQKQANKQTQHKPQKASQQVFNQYQEKLRQYKGKSQNQKFKYSQKNVFQEQSTVKNNKLFGAKQPQQAYRNTEKKHYDHYSEDQFSINQLKTEVYPKYSNYSQAYYKNNVHEKELVPNPPINSTAPIYNNSAPYYNPSYPYTPSPYGYPPAVHQSQKIDRLPAKYGQVRQREAYERSYYYGAGWQPSYYMPPPPGGTVIQPPIQPTEHQNSKNFAYGNSKTQKKHQVYPSNPNYTSYPGTGYPNYYPNQPSHYPLNQRPDYPHTPTNMRMPPPPNTSININFPMYVGSPYHGGYPYPPPNNAQRYPPNQPTIPTASGQYMHPVGNTPSYGYSSSGLSSLPPYAQYQEYKKRQNQRRR